MAVREWRVCLNPGARATALPLRVPVLSRHHASRPPTDSSYRGMPALPARPREGASVPSSAWPSGRLRFVLASPITPFGGVSRARFCFVTFLTPFGCRACYTVSPPRALFDAVRSLVFREPSPARMSSAPDARAISSAPAYRYGNCPHGQRSSEATPVCAAPAGLAGLARGPRPRGPRSDRGRFGFFPPALGFAWGAVPASLALFL